MGLMQMHIEIRRQGWMEGYRGGGGRDRGSEAGRRHSSWLPPPSPPVIIPGRRYSQPPFDESQIVHEP